MPTFAMFMVMGMFLMFLCMWAANSISYKYSLWKIALSAAVLTCIGLLGAHIMAWIESGNWSARSFYGAVFLAPVLMWPVSMILRINYLGLIDLCAPAECIMLALLKVKCRIDGCCYGRTFDTPTGGVQFPSQIGECAAAIILMIVLVILLRRSKREGMIYPYYLILYGITRFILNMFRETTPWIGPLPAGHFWSLISVGIGIIALVVLKNKKEA